VCVCVPMMTLKCCFRV